MELTPRQKDFIIDCFRIITITHIDSLKSTGYFDGYNEDSIDETAEEIENILMEYYEKG